MKCSAEDCNQETTYKQLCLCQKHYFRLWRNGKTELKRKRQPRVTMPGKGYQRLFEPTHPLADTQGYVGEHRAVMFAEIGFDLNACALCGKPETWKTVHIDHVDQNPKNNQLSNLRPLCRACNTFRIYPQRHTFKGNHSISFMGVTATAREWSRATNGYLNSSTIVRRIASGMTPEQALLTLKVSHKGMGDVPYNKEEILKLARYYNAETKKLKATT